MSRFIDVLRSRFDLSGSSARFYLDAHDLSYEDIGMI